MICLCESEIVLTHLHLYARRVYPGIPYDEVALRSVLEEAGITRIRELLNLGEAIRKDLADCVLARLECRVLPDSCLKAA